MTVKRFMLGYENMKLQPAGLRHPWNRLFRHPAFLVASLFLILSLPARVTGATAMIFCNGNMGSAAGLTTSQINGLRSSGMTTMVLFTMSVDANGNFNYNGQLVCSNGVYVGPSNWGSLLNQCRTAPSGITRIEMCIGGWGDTSWANIKNVIASNGTNTTSILYRNLTALKTAIGIEAIDSDDEGTYDSASAISFGKMCGSVGLKLTLCPYTNVGYWQAVRSGLGSICDAIYLQCYDGGAGNDPATWDTYFGGMKVVAGYWDSERDTTFLTRMQAWSAAGGPGGFLWPSCSGCSPPAGPSEMLQYATWIQQAFYRFQPTLTPATGFSAIAAYNSEVMPASTVFTLSNSTAAAISWSLVNTSSWLNVSTTAGTVPAGAIATVTASLNTAVATNLAAGFYSANLVFTNLSTGGAPATRSFTLNTAVANWPFTLLGYNAALLASNNATAGSPNVTAFDLPNNYCFYQQGLPGGSQGLPLTGCFSSQSDSATAFQLGPYGAPDALLLGDTYPKSGTLTLATPLALNSLVILAASANGGGQGSVVLNFSDGSHSAAFAFNCQDWFYVVTNVAVQGFGRLKLGPTFSIENNGTSNPNMYQTTINLAALGLTQPVSSITFSNPSGAGATQTTAIFALSGMPGSVPLLAPNSVAAAPGTNATVQLSWNPSAGATNYIIEQSTTSGSGFSAVASTVQTNMTLTGLANGTLYYFVVSAQGTSSTSTNSSEVSAMPGSYAGWILSAKPVAYWPLNETSGTVANELVQGSNGIYSGGYTFIATGAAGAGFDTPHRAVLFNGSSGYTLIPRAIGDTNFSIVFWVRTSATGGSPNWYNGMGLVDGEVGGTTGDFGVALVGGKIGFGVGNPDTTLPSSKSVNNGIWHQVAVTRNAGSGAMNIYIDGLIDASTTGPTGVRTNPPGLRIGSLQTGVDFFPGSISDVAMYKQVLSPNQIAAFYSAATGLFYNVALSNTWNGNNLVLSWPGNGKLLESTNLSGPWMTNASPSPVSIPPAEPQKYYRILVQ
jgi:hypothetical protein